MKAKINKISLIVAIVSLVIMCSTTIAYARFYRQYNPEVSKFDISVSSQDNMMLSTTGNPGTFKDKVSYGDLATDLSVALSPVAANVETTADETYKVLSFSPNDATKIKKFPLYFLGSSDMNLYLKGDAGGEFVKFSGGNVENHFDQDDMERLKKNLRVGFLTYSTAYQTGSGAVYSDYPTSVNIYATEETNNSYMTFTELGYSQTDRDTVLASTKKNEVTMIEVVIWLEEDGLGTLEAICELTLSLRFEAVPI